jgi:hypothetical protein
VKLVEREAAAHVRRAPKTLRSWRYLGRGPAYTVAGGRVLYDVADLDAWLDAARVTPPR